MSDKSRFSSIDTEGLSAVQRKNLTEFTQDPQNANRGTKRGSEMLKTSLADLGAGRSLLADRNGILIAGNKTHAAAIEQGLVDAIVVQTDGRQIIAVQRTDLDLVEQAKARRMAIADNRIGQVDLEWDEDILYEINSANPQMLAGLWSDQEIKQSLSSVQPEDITEELPEFKEYDESIAEAELKISLTFVMVGPEIEVCRKALQRHPRGYWSKMLVDFLSKP